MIEAIICDMDGTLVEYTIPPFYSSWDALSLALSKEKAKEWIENRDFYYPRVELHKEWQTKQLGLLRNLSLEEANKFLLPIPYCSGVKEFFSDKGNGYKKGIISSGINLVADKILQEFEFDFAMSFFIEVKNGKLTGRGKSNGSLWEKGSVLVNFASENNLNLNNVAYIGDNENDISAFKSVGIPVAFKPKTEATKNNAKYIINDFKELNQILEDSK